MNCNHNDGGPAFPRLYPRSDDDGNYGMTLREYFAAAAMAGMLAGGSNIGDALSDMAFAQADSMLRRCKKPTSRK